MSKSLLYRNHNSKYYFHFRIINIDIHTWSKKAFNDTVVNREFYGTVVNREFNFTVVNREFDGTVVNREFDGTAVNRELPSLHGGSLEVPLLVI